MKGFRQLILHNPARMFGRPARMLAILIIMIPLTINAQASAYHASSAIVASRGFPENYTIKSLDTSGCNPVITPADPEAEQSLVDLVNQERRLNKLPPLKRSTSLDLAARAHSLDLAQDAYFEHDTYDRIDDNLDWICLWSTRVSAYKPDWIYLGENIVAGVLTADSAMAAWMDSAGHRENILSLDYWEIGVGFASGGPMEAYWTQDFARTYDAYPLIINADAEATDSPQVEVYIYGTWTELRLRINDNSWSEWQPFQNTLQLQLPDISGNHTIYAEMRTSTLTAESNDSIFLEVPILPELSDLPEQLTFTYSVVDARFYPGSITIYPDNIASDTTLAWSVILDSTDFIVSPETGVTPAAITITPNPETIFPDLEQHVATLTVQVTEPELVSNSSQTIELSITPSDTHYTHIYLPFINTTTP